MRLGPGAAAGLAALSMLLAPLSACALELNAANRAQLESLRGVGIEGADRILVERERAAFTDWADFMRRVKGVKQGLARRFSKAGLTVNGVSLHDGKLPPPTLPTETPGAR